MRLRTIADLVQYRHGLSVDCWRCRRYVEIDLEALIREGRGELPYMQARFRCTQCGQPGAMQLVAPAPMYGGKPYPAERTDGMPLPECH